MELEVEGLRMVVMQCHILVYYNYYQRDTKGVVLNNYLNHLITTTTNMTKLMEWLTGAILFLGPWTAIVTTTIHNEFTVMHYQEILLLPFLLVAVFAVVSIAIIAFRVYSFNDCHQEAKELQEQILQAKADLAKRGIKLD
ncbi:hypothetical protein Pmani_016501 [Petrolisthes manimaculis]|uniref:Dolichol-phosphate mannosyltransferase subunit 3 n=1 Tax=Petrolisthes manimaculis TaxID=1843537 RepID=A0AAE1UAG1_9EUCA|nr:hypothetical protein Pmani_016501 [Petrolisthes manimaculis]